MLGSWHPANALTLAGVVAASAGIWGAIQHRLPLAVTCLVIAGLCDLFDGTFARRFERDDRTRAFGVQLDSLADVASFVALPVALAAALGATRWWQLLVLALYAMAGVNRLAQFNLGTQFNLGAEHARPEATRTHYRGLPVTWASLVVSLVAVASHWLHGSTDLVLTGVMALLGIAFVADVPVPKPRGLALVVLLLLAIAIIVAANTWGVA